MRRRNGGGAVPGSASPAAGTQAHVPTPAPAAPGTAYYGRLFRKYLVLILSLVCGALLLSGTISVYFSYQEQQVALGSLQEEKAVAASSRIEQYVRQIERQLAYAALPQLDASDVELRRIEFLKLLRQVPEVTDACWIDADGREQLCVSRLGMDRFRSGKDWSQAPAFLRPKRGTPWFGPVYFKKETEPYMTVAVRPSGDTGPVTVAELNLKFVWDVVSRIKVGERGKAYVVDRSGYLVADPDIGLVLRKTYLGELAHVKAALGSAPHEDAAMRSHDLAGMPVLAAWAPIETLDWMVFVEQPVAEVYAKLNASIVRTGLLLLAGLVGSAIVALVLARGMVRPIRTLSEGARRIGEGDLDQRIDVRTGDELEALADRFNRMSGQLKESYAGLERKVEARTSELQNSLEQQTAISEILRVISASPTDVKPVLEAVAERAAHLCAATYARVLLIDGAWLEPIAGFQDGHSASDTELAATVAVPLDRTSLTGRAALERRTIHEADIVPLLAHEYPGARTNMQMFGLHAVLVVPLMRESGAYGGIILARTAPGRFRDDQVALVETFARQAAIAIDNVRLFNATKEALDQQRASGEVLAAISSSIADTAPVFETILASCERLFDGRTAAIDLVGEDGLAHIGAYHGPGLDALRGMYPHAVDMTSATGTAIVTRNVVHYPDVEAVPAVARTAFAAMGIKAAIGAPMLSEGKGIGAIWVTRDYEGRFSDKEIALLRTFADQAVIAIQNARLFREIADKSRQLEIANQHKSAFLASMSHELRTPLNAIIGFSEVLLERYFGELNDKQDDYLKDIHSSGRHLLALINEVLDLSKVEAGRMELDRTDFDLAAALADAMTLIRERAQQHAIALRLDAAPDLGSIHADERKFKQILLNLLSNAVKFTPDGGRIDVTATRNADGVEVAVRDTGIGIAPEDQDAVFEEFRQVGRDYMSKHEGTGLGLALCKRLVELHGGRIWLDSTPGHGSTFHFTLPHVAGTTLAPEVVQ